MHRWQTDKRLSNAYPSMQYFYCDSTRSQGSNVGASNVMRSHSYQQMSSRPAAGSLLLALAFICVCISPTACQPQTPPDTRINRRVDSPAGSSIDTAGDIGRLLASADALALLQRLDGSTLQRLAAADSTIVSQMQPAATTTTGTGAAISTDAEATTGTGLSQAPRRRQLPWLNALINEGLGSGNVTFPLGSVGSGLAVAGQGGGADGSGAAALAALLRALGGTGGEGSETSGAVSRTSSPLGTLGQGILLERLAQPDAPRASQQRVGLVGQGGDNILGVSPAPAAEVLPMDGLSANATQRGQALAAAADAVRAWAEGMARDSGNVTGLGSQALGTGSTGFSIGGTAAWSNDSTLLGGLAGMPLGALLQQRSGDLSSSGADAGAPGSTASAAAASLMDPLGVLQRLMVQSAPANPSRNTELPGSGAFLEGLLSNAPLAAVVSSSGGVRNAAGSSEGSPAGTLLGSGLGIARLSGLAGAGLQPPVGGVDGLVPWTDVLTEAAQSNRTDARW